MQPPEDFHYGWREHMHAEETQVMPGPHSWNNKPLLRLRRSGLFRDCVHAIQAIRAGHAAAPDRAIAGKQALASRLDGGYGTGLRSRHLQQLRSRTLAGAGV